MGKSLNIAFFTDNFFPGTGGTENVIKIMSKILTNGGGRNRVKIYCPDYHKKNQNEIDIPVFRVPSIDLSDSDHIALPSLIKGKLEKDLRQFKPDIIYFTTGSGMAKWALKMGKKLDVPVVATIHTKFDEAWYDSCKSHLITSCMVKSLARKMNRAFGVTTVSYDAARTLQRYGYKGQPKVIMNGFNASEFSMTPCLEDKKGRFTFLFCGRLIKVKQIQFSLKCLANIKKKHNFNDFNFWIVGDGVYRKKLEKLVKKYNLEDNVKFFGFVGDRAVLNGFYSAADLFLFPSSFDTDGLVIVEAKSCHLPVLSLKNYGCGERIEDGVTGFLSEFDEESFTEKIWEILNNKPLLEKVRKNVDKLRADTWEEVVEKYHQYFVEKIEEYKNLKKKSKN